MSNAPQAQKPQAQNIPSTQSKTPPIDTNVKKGEQGAKDRMQNEGGHSSSSDKKPTQGGCS